MISQQLEAFGKPLAQVLRETPEPQGNEVIVKIGSSGVCHSDVHLHDGRRCRADCQRREGGGPPRCLPVDRLRAVRRVQRRQ